MRIPKSLLSLVLAFMMCLTLTIPAFAADEIFLCGYENDYYGTRAGGKEKSLFQLTGSNLTQTGTVVYTDWGADMGYDGFILPVYTASGPVTVILTDTYSLSPWDLVFTCRVDQVTYHPETKSYDVVKENCDFFDGTVEYIGLSGDIAGESSIKDYITENLWETTYNDTDPNVRAGASLTLSTPGTYHIETYLMGVDGSCEAVIIIPEGSSAPAAPAASTGFTDVAADAYYADSVKWAVEKNITSGTSTTTFSPSNTCTNAQILTFLWRAYGQPEPSVSNPFSNSIPEAYAKAAVWAYEKGMVSGTAFDVNQPCTRAMAAAYLWQAAGSPAPSAAASFTDVSASASYAQAVAWALEKGITTGTSANTFSPDDICNRGQIVTFLYRNLA